MSDDLHLNEVDSVRLLVSANQEVDFNFLFALYTLTELMAQTMDGHMIWVHKFFIFIVT